MYQANETWEKVPNHEIFNREPAYVRYFVDVVKDRLLESAGQRAESGDGQLDSLPHLLVLQGLVIGHVIGKLPVSKEKRGRRPENEWREKDRQEGA